MISVVIPAHNEEAVIASTLRSVLEGLEQGAEVLVVCNGCSDDTAAVAGTFGLPVRVLEIEPASKVAALNAGDEVAAGYPRIYLDADVTLDGPAPPPTSPRRSVTRVRWPRSPTW